MRATLETRRFQKQFVHDFGSILGPPLGPVWAHVGNNLFDVFLRWLLGAVFIDLTLARQLRLALCGEPSEQNGSVQMHLYSSQHPSGPPPALTNDSMHPG